MAASAPLLAYERLRSAPLSGEAAAQAPAVIAVLHGVTGSSGQLAPFTQQLIDAAAAAAGRPVEAVLINQRGHGGSRNLPFSPPHNVEACTEDALALLRRDLGPQAAPTAILGHSLGGKVALSLLARLAADAALLPKQVWAIDAAAGETDPASFALLLGMLKNLAALQQPLDSLEPVKQAVADVGLPEPAQKYMASRCDQLEGGGFRTTFDPAMTRSMLESYLVHFINGGESDILEGCPEEKARFTAGMAAKHAAGSTGPSADPVQYWEVPGAAHFVPWTHAAELAAAVAPVLAGALAVA
ncbi:hypothetical protein ABPG75_003370 [Micractinium tetrahymenae]